jgi:hypothetical protein
VGVELISPYAPTSWPLLTFQQNSKPRRRKKGIDPWPSGPLTSTSRTRPGDKPDNALTKGIKNLGSPWPLLTLFSVDETLVEDFN